MVSIFEYTDYRKYLSDFYTYRKQKNRAFSHRYIQEKVGFKSTGHFSQILSGRANMSLLYADKMTQFLQLNEKESSYFHNMVLFNHADSEDEKKHYFEKMQEFKESVIKLIESSQCEFYDKWYYAAIREVLNFFPFTGNYRELGVFLTPTVPASDVQHAVALLEKLQMIKIDELGVVHLCDPLISTSMNLPSPVINNCILNNIELSKNALTRFVKSERNFSWVTFSVSDKCYQSLVHELRGFRRHLMELIAKDEQPDRAYLLNFQLLPISQRNKRGK